MGSKPSNLFQMDRPESGGADRKGEHETRGRLDPEKRHFAEAESEMKQAAKHPQDHQEPSTPAKKAKTPRRK